MNYLKRIKVDTEDASAISVEYESGYVSKDLKVAQFYMVMQDKDASLNDVDSYINLGKYVNSDVDWDEAKKVLQSFRKETL